MFAAVFVPLRRALEEVSWQVRVRAQIEDEIAALPLAHDAVDSSVSVGRHAVHVRLLVVGDAISARALERDLSARIFSVAGVQPSIDVIAVPNAETLKREVQAAHAEPAPPPTTVRVTNLNEARSLIDSELAAHWPTDAAGPLIDWRIDAPAHEPAAIEVVHLGPPLGGAGEHVLADLLAEHVGAPVTIRDIPLSAEAIPDDHDGWMGDVASALQTADRFPGIYACVLGPPSTEVDAGRTPDGGADRGQAIASLIAGMKTGRGRMMIAGSYAAPGKVTSTTRVAVEAFWEYLAFAMNSLVFLLIGIEVPIGRLLDAWCPILLAFLAVTIGRAGVVFLASARLRPTRERIPWRWSVVLVWGGLRGALSMVLALALPDGFPNRDLIVTMTFGVVLLSIVVQGVTAGPLLRALEIVPAAPNARN